MPRTKVEKPKPHTYIIRLHHDICPAEAIEERIRERAYRERTSYNSLICEALAAYFVGKPEPSP